MRILHNREGSVPAEPSFLLSIMQNKKRHTFPFLSKEGKVCLLVHTLTDELDQLSVSYLSDC